MGTCASKVRGVEAQKEYVVTPEGITETPFAETNSQVHHDKAEGPVDDATVAVKLPPAQATSSLVLDEEVVRGPEETTSTQSRLPKKASRSADDIPISSTYHRVQSAGVAEQESKR
ncbi:hypothetical protein PHYBOEH_004608 [Phytophthora boehmeriae]|uniref:Uncharacterized protein n=1 Tax=Phytophthora boehmeriae TaxID=109152 RepID=A0A8T1WLC9_9STRA|nr:hypothetical protein PHYBOEH_004608 [Phytophthora boehmeriae]